MAEFRPRVEDLPSEFAVFPLPGALLLPGGRLPLNIFEPRYLAMIEDALAHGRMFAMIQPDASLPDAPHGPAPHGPALHGPALHRIGCLGKMASFSETEDGRFVITLTGLARFSIASEIDMRRGYRRVIGDFSRFRADMAEPEETPIDREATLAALRGYFAQRGVEPNWDAINRLTDDVLVVTLAMVCPFEPIEKQALLEAMDPADRADTLLALLRMGAAETGDTSGRPVS